MNKIYSLALLTLLTISCGVPKSSKSHKAAKLQEIVSVEISTIVSDSSLNVRALAITKMPEEEDIIVFLTSKGELGTLLPKSIIGHIYPLKDKPYYVHKINLSTDSLKLNFRSLAITNTRGFGMSIGSPAILYEIDADLEKNKIVYRENHPKAFYDALEFWNEEEGIAIGDPTENCMSILITRDGGDTWSKLACEFLPDVIDGEAAFAASDTNIAIVGDNTWVATGGKASRVLYSPDKGQSWEVFETPIVQGLATTGMYSIDFYDAQHGFAIGGDYTKPEANAANKIRTKDGGRTWELVAQNQNPGYRSCVQYVPNSEAKELVAIGFKGIDYSNDSGNTWKHLSDEGFYTLRFQNDSVAFAAGNSRIAKLSFKK